MGHNTTELGKMTKCMAKDPSNGEMAQLTKVIGTRAKCKETVHSLGLMETTIPVTSTKTKNTVSAPSSGKTVKSTPANG